MKIDGQCHCGAIAWEAEIDPDRVNLCHCTDCQVLTGTAYRLTARTQAGGFRIVRGTPKIYVKTAESGQKREQAFCGDCGTPLYAADPGPFPKVVGVRLGSANQLRELRPGRQFWHRSALPWTQDLTAIPTIETA